MDLHWQGRGWWPAALMNAPRQLPAATAALMRHQLCRGQWRSCRGQRWQPNCGSDGAVASSGRSAAAAAVREGLTAVAAARGEISAASTSAAAPVQASTVAGMLLQRLRGEISAASTTAAAVVRGSVACIAIVIVLSSCCVQS